jgi:hypothetical protein
VKSCCTTASTVLPCHLNNTFKPVCPNCRCLEQFQRTVLPGQNVDEATFRVALATVDSFAVDMLPGVPRDAREFHWDTGSPGASVLLKTCTLLC